MPRVPDQLDRRSVPSFVHAYGSSSSTSRSPMRSSSREAPAYAAPIYSWFRIQIWNWNGLCLHLCYWFENPSILILVCKWKRNRLWLRSRTWIRNRLWIHRPWIFYRWLRNRFFNDLWFNPGRQRRSRSRGYGLTMNSSSTDLNYCGFPSVPRASIRCSSRSSSRSSCSFTSSIYDDDLEPTEKAAEQAVRYPVTEPADRPS